MKEHGLDVIVNGGRKKYPIETCRGCTVFTKDKLGKKKKKKVKLSL
jgi:hypothetical protein